MNIQKIRFETGAGMICNFFLISWLFFCGEGGSKRFIFLFYLVKLSYDFTPVATASGGLSCVQPYLI